MRVQTALLLLTANVLGGATYAAMKLAMAGVPASWVVAIRIGLVGLGAGIALGRDAMRWEYRGRDLGLLLLVSVLGYALPIALILPGLRHAPSVNASLLILLEPIGIVILSALFLKERSTRMQAAGILLGLAGSALVILEGAPGRVEAGGELQGNLILALQALLWSVWTVAAKPLLKRHSALSVTYASSVAAFLCVLPFVSTRTAGVTSSGMLWSAVVGVAMFVSSWCWNEGLQRASAAVVAAFIFTQPLVGVLLGRLAFGERLGPWAMGGGAVTCLAVLLVAKGERKAIAA